MIKKIESEEEYQRALTRVEFLMDLDPEKESEEGRELGDLADAIVEYERTEFPISKPSWLDRLLFRIDQEGGLFRWLFNRIFRRKNGE
jgi:antitoxin component HigA of HigAB toxin-antitoxin module